MPSRQLKAVFFDAAGTLFTVNGSVGEIYAAIAHHYGSAATSKTIQDAFVRNFRGAGPVTVENQKRWWKDIVHRVFTEAGMVGVWTKADSVTLFDDFTYGAK